MSSVVDVWRRGGASADDAPIVPTAATLPDAVSRRVVLLGAAFLGAGVAVLAAGRGTSGWGSAGMVAAACCLCPFALWVTRSERGPERFLIGAAAVLGAGVGTNIAPDRWTWPYQVPSLALVVLLPFLVRWTGPSRGSASG